MLTVYSRTRWHVRDCHVSCTSSPAHSLMKLTLLPLANMIAMMSATSATQWPSPRSYVRGLGSDLLIERGPT